MSTSSTPARRRARRGVGCAVASAIVIFFCALAVQGGGSTAVGRQADPWVWPLASFSLARAYEAPAHRYAPGHRGIDIAAGPDTTVSAPAAGVIAFAGLVVDRSLVTIDHGDGIVSTLEPVTTTLEPGILVERGEAVGQLSTGGHAYPGTLHLGVRLHGEYVNPLLFLGGVPRAVLLPCC